ncbi:MAG: DKNYY domain-containing protein, partial [Candidatus Mucispirillum faecigallinarum]|nr:DKNYY domain-containing protein [Candidatus Mucispirillum faecigallinarum]
KVVILSNNYIKDDSELCYLEEDWEGYLTANTFTPHINSFDILPENSAFSFDRFKIYFKGKEIEGIDLTSISMIGDNYLQDKTNIYCGNVKLENADIGYFMLLGDGYASDGKNTFYQAKQLETQNMLHILGQGYATDGITFWLYGSVLSNPYEYQYITDILGQGFI